ncbi:MAG TPA: hypothetical protein VKA13_04515 [Gammaproteobacteria bacterium]|nr:hypothetical protein [Gammaproteobacteria bacterium]
MSREMYMAAHPASQATIRAAKMSDRRICCRYEGAGLIVWETQVCRQGCGRHGESQPGHMVARIDGTPVVVRRPGHIAQDEEASIVG